MPRRKKAQELWFFADSQISDISNTKYKKYLKLFFTHSRECKALLNKELLVLGIKLMIMHQALPEDFRKDFTEQNGQIGRYLQYQ
ncbi:MAG: hypothetical protein O3B09_02790, partial [Proteobacteria bacterium]|nr:hypothetical protein [Pseudomonadota bacterium]